MSRYKHTGNVYINSTGNAGLTLYAAIPRPFKRLFINEFKRNPKAVIGITRVHLIVRTIKAMDKYGLVFLFLPVVGLSVLLSMLHPYLLWVVFFGSIVLLALIIRKSLRK